MTVERSGYCASCLLRAADGDADAPVAWEADEAPPCELLSVIGESPRAVVFLGQQNWPVSRLVACKLFSREPLCPDSDPVRHPPVPWHRAIAPVLERGRIHGRPYIVTPYLGGGPLVRRCEHLKIGAIDRIVALIAVAEGVAFAHAHGVPHGRLVPQNVLCEPHSPFAVQIVDFAGNARKAAGKEPFDVLVRADLDGLVALAATILRPLAGTARDLEEALARLRVSTHSAAELAAGLRGLS